MLCPFLSWPAACRRQPRGHSKDVQQLSSQKKEKESGSSSVAFCDAPGTIGADYDAQGFPVARSEGPASADLDVDGYPVHPPSGPPPSQRPTFSDANVTLRSVPRESVGDHPCPRGSVAAALQPAARRRTASAPAVEGNKQRSSEHGVFLLSREEGSRIERFLWELVDNDDTEAATDMHERIQEATGLDLVRLYYRACFTWNEVPVPIKQLVRRAHVPVTLSDAAEAAFAVQYWAARDLVINSGGEIVSDAQPLPERPQQPAASPAAETAAPLTRLKRRRTRPPRDQRVRSAKQLATAPSAPPPEVASPCTSAASAVDDAGGPVPAEVIRSRSPRSAAGPSGPPRAALHQSGLQHAAFLGRPERFGAGWTRSGGVKRRSYLRSARKAFLLVLTWVRTRVRTMRCMMLGGSSVADPAAPSHAPLLLPMLTACVPLV